MVVDATGQALAHVYFEEERGRRELRMLSDRQSWEDIIPPTHDV